MGDLSRVKLREAYRKEPSGRTREKLHAALLRKMGKSEAEIAAILGRSQNTVSRWLHRLQEEGLEGRHARKIPGKPCKLTAEQQEEVRKSLLKNPQKSGFKRGTWTGPLLVSHISDTYDKAYSRGGALALAHRLGFSVRNTRPTHPKSATKKERREFVRETKKSIAKYVRDGYTVVCVDASAIQNGSNHSRGLRLRGGRESTKVNFSKTSIKMYGAIGDGICEIIFREKADSDSLIELLEILRKKYGKLIVMIHNASAHKSKKIREYLEDANGDVVLCYTPPYTPEENPIEILWREIKNAIAEVYYKGGFPEMEESIRQMMDSGEIRIVSLYKYMLRAIKSAKRNMPAHAVP